MMHHALCHAKRSTSFLTVLVVVHVVHATAMAAEVYEVDRFDDDAAATACSAADNDCSLRGAIRKANTDGDATTIVLPDGTYQLTIAGSNEDGCMTGDLDIRAPLEIDAEEGAHPVVEQTVTDRIFETLLGIGSLTLRGPLTLKGGYVTTGTTHKSGGLIRANRSGSLTLEHVTLMNGHTDGLGGCLAFGNPTIAADLLLTDVTVHGCTTAANGGGVYAEVGDSTATFERVVVEDNTADGSGGGVMIALSRTTVVFEDSSVQNNVAKGPATNNGAGGGVLLSQAQARIERSTVAMNSAGGFSGSNGLGGGIYLWDSDLTLRNSTVSGNSVSGSSSQGSAILLRDGATVFVDQSTIVGDPVSSLIWPAVGIYSTGGAVTFEGSIVEGGCANWAGSLGTFTSNGFNVERPIDGAVFTQCGLTNPSDVVTSSPVLLPLAGYGGPTQTHALIAGAPAISLVSSGSCESTDQRYAPRAFLFCDAGSYESSGQAPGMWLFSDGFESGNTAAWTNTVP